MSRDPIQDSQVLHSRVEKCHRQTASLKASTLLPPRSRCFCLLVGRISLKLLNLIRSYGKGYFGVAGYTGVMSALVLMDWVSATK